MHTRQSKRTGMVWTVDPDSRDNLVELSNDDIDIRLFGDFQVRTGMRLIGESEWPLRRARNLVKLLALATGHRMHREQLMDVLWPEQAQDAAANNLHKALHIARRVLEPNLQMKAASRFLQLHGDLVVLQAPGTVSTDTDRFRSLVESARASERVDDYMAALSVYRADLLLQDPYEDWAISHREHLRHLRVDLLLDLSQALDDQDEIEGAIEVLQQVIAIDGAHEQAHHNLISLLARSGHRQLALRQYLALKIALHEELGAEPDPSIQALYDDIKNNRLPERPRHHAGRRFNQQKYATIVPRPTVLGRGQEVGDLCDRIDDLQAGIGHVALVCGEAGSGKTHLLQKVTDYASHRGATVLRGTISELDLSIGYEHLIAALSTLSHSITPGGQVADEAAHLIKKLALVSSMPTNNSDARKASEEAACQAVVTFFSQLCASGPVLLALDDLRAADECSLACIRAVAHLAVAHPLLIIGLTRPQPAPDPKYIFNLIPGIPEAKVTRLGLHPLALSETAALVTDVLRAPAERKALELVHRVGGGLPHFVRETAMALVGRGALQLERGQWILRTDGPIMIDRQVLRQPRTNIDWHTRSAISAAQ